MGFCTKKRKIVSGFRDITLNEFDPAKHKPDLGRSQRADTRKLERIRRQYPSNVTKSAKYTFLNFIPLSLFYNFSKYTNLYFLLMTLLMLTKYSPFSLSSVVSPILFITLVSMIREGLEDYSRYKSDK